jgi:hypothetical protein
VIRGTFLEKISKTDRPALKIKALGSRIPTPPLSEDESFNGDGGGLVASWVNPKNKSIIAKIYRKVLESGTNGIRDIELKNFINEIGADESWYGYLYNKNRRYHIAFEKIDGITRIKDNL